MSSPPTIATPEPPHFFADLYTFDWSAFSVRLPLVSASAVALCVFGGLALGHPGGALVAAGGALQNGFGPNQRIRDSRLLPMIFGVLAMSTAAFCGTLAGHHGYELILAAALSAALYGILTIRHSGLAWVGQQASVALFVASAFPDTLEHASTRAGLTALGGTLQLIITSFGLRLLPELGRDLLSIHHGLVATLYEQRRELLHRLRDLPQSLPAPARTAALVYALRLLLTVTLASELYRHLGIQSGYWIPMTALLVQKPAFFETLTRSLMRVGGTLTGAYLATLLVAHIPISNWVLAALVTFFAFCCFSTVSINYGLYAISITAYIVFLLSLNQIPGPEIAHRRAFCTIAGASIALLLHLDALRRHKTNSTQT